MYQHFCGVPALSTTWYTTLTYCFYHFLPYHMCTSCTTTTNLVQKRILFFNSFVFQLNFFSFCWYIWYTFWFFLLFSITYRHFVAGTQVVHTWYTCWYTIHESRSTILDSLVPPSSVEEFEEFFIRNFFAKFIYESLTHYLPTAPDRTLPRITQLEPCFVYASWNLVSQ